ncbi:hypothetical protein BGZ81_006898 [Podila clonocystis]|nr:hypothetical protein BGZ81_006898 [Podila clonocystis]
MLEVIVHTLPPPKPTTVASIPTGGIITHIITAPVFPHGDPNTPATDDDGDEDDPEDEEDDLLDSPSTPNENNNNDDDDIIHVPYTVPKTSASVLVMEETSTKSPVASNKPLQQQPQVVPVKNTPVVGGPTQFAVMASVHVRPPVGAPVSRSSQQGNTPVSKPLPLTPIAAEPTPKSSCPVPAAEPDDEEDNAKETVSADDEKAKKSRIAEVEAQEDETGQSVRAHKMYKNMESQNALEPMVDDVEDVPLQDEPTFKVLKGHDNDDDKNEGKKKKKKNKKMDKSDKDDKGKH